MTNEELLEIVKPYTMASPARIQLLIGLANLANEKGLAGDFVECGVCNGGSAAVLAHFAARSYRNTHLFDSWQGLPATTKEDLPSANGNTAESEIGKCVGDLDKVKEVFGKVGAISSKCFVHVGWFQDSFPISAPSIQHIAMLNLDSDWYESELLCWNTWYDKLLDGAPVYIDDFYYWSGCQKAFHDFMDKRCLSPSIHRVEHSAWFIKNGK